MTSSVMGNKILAGSFGVPDSSGSCYHAGGNIARAGVYSHKFSIPTLLGPSSVQASNKARILPIINTMHFGLRSLKVRAPASVDAEIVHST